MSLGKRKLSASVVALNKFGPLGTTHHNSKVTHVSAVI